MRLGSDLTPPQVVHYPGCYVEGGGRVEDGVTGDDFIHTEEEEDNTTCLKFISMTSEFEQ